MGVLIRWCGNPEVLPELRSNHDGAKPWSRRRLADLTTEEMQKVLDDADDLGYTSGWNDRASSAAVPSVNQFPPAVGAGVMLRAWATGYGLGSAECETHLAGGFTERGEDQEDGR